VLAEARARAGELAEHGGGALVHPSTVGHAPEVSPRLTHAGFSADPALADVHERHVQGWHGFLANLKSVLEDGADDRDAMGVRTAPVSSSSASG
jgi:hypothetical protein